MVTTIVFIICIVFAILNLGDEKKFRRGLVMLMTVPGLLLNSKMG